MAEKEHVIVSTDARSAVRFLDEVEFVPLSKADTFGSKEAAEAALDSYPFDRIDERALRLRGEWVCLEKAEASQLLNLLEGEIRFKTGFYGSADELVEP